MKPTFLLKNVLYACLKHKEGNYSGNVELTRTCYLGMMFVNSKGNSCFLKSTPLKTYLLLSWVEILSPLKLVWSISWSSHIPYKINTLFFLKRNQVFDLKACLVDITYKCVHTKNNLYFKQIWVWYNDNKQITLYKVKLIISVYNVLTL